MVCKADQMSHILRGIRFSFIDVQKTVSGHWDKDPCPSYGSPQDAIDQDLRRRFLVSGELRAGRGSLRSNEAGYLGHLTARNTATPGCHSPRCYTANPGTQVAGHSAD
jgi:hypothetical protein